MRAAASRRPRRLGAAAEPAQQVGADGVEEVVAVEVELVDERERGLRPVDLGDRDGAVERDDRARREREELVVERRICRQSVSAAARASLWTALIAAWIWYGPGWLRRRHAPDERLALGDQVAIPAAAVLVGEQDEVAVRRRCAWPGATRSAASARAAPCTSGSSGMSSASSRPSRIASAQRSSRTSRSPELAV